MDKYFVIDPSGETIPFQDLEREYRRTDAYCFVEDKERISNVFYGFLKKEYPFENKGKYVVRGLKRLLPPEYISYRW